MSEAALKEKKLEILRQKAKYYAENKLELYDPYPFQVKFHNDLSMKRGLQAANQIGKCLTNQTLIDTTNGRKKIGDIFGTECEVLTYPNYEPRKVLNWVRKPKEECFRITLADGQWVEVPNGHRILVGSEYVFVEQLLLALPSSVFCPPQTNSVFGQLARILNVQHWMRKGIDYLGDYLVDCRLYDAQLLSSEDSVQVFSPLQDGAQQRSDRLSRLGGLAYKGICILSDKLHRLSNLDAYRRTLGQYASRLFPSFAYDDLCMNENNQNAQQFSKAEYPDLSSHELHRLRYWNFSDTPFVSPDISLAANQIVSVYSVGFKTLYDMEVEERHNYIAGGLVHHNTISSTAEDAIHLTGKYPDWWEGRRYDRPVRLVCGGINNDKTCALLQKALFGDPVTGDESLGTGWVPKSDIGKISKKRGVADAFLHVKVKHYTDSVFDGWSQVTFLAYEMGKATWMGDTIDIFHLDEEPPMDILTQAGRGCIASGGIVYLSYTPENGRTDVVQMVENEWGFHRAEWADVAGEDFSIEVEGETLEFKTVHTISGKKGHLTQEKVLEAQRIFPAYTMKMRAKGIPVLGSGLVFEYSEETIKCEPIDIPSHWPRIAAIDFGGIAKKSHPSAVVYGAYDETNDIIYIYDGFRLYSAEIADVAARMLSRPAWIPVMWPHDGNKEVPGGSTVTKEYQGYGVNMFHTHWTNPPDDNKGEGSGGIKIEPGIVSMSNRIKDRRLRVFNTLPDWFEEYRQYHLKDGKIVDREDDYLAASRYLIQSIRHAVVEEDDDFYEDDYNDHQRNATTGY